MRLHGSDGPRATLAVADVAQAGDVLGRRAPARIFAERPLTEHEMLQLCWAAQGIAPAAERVSALELSMATSAGYLAYDSRGHRLVRRQADDLRAAMQGAALSQEPVGQAPVVFIVASDRKRSAGQIGTEADEAARNLLLEAIAMGLGAVPIGAFDGSRLRVILQLPADLEVLHLIPVGKPAS